MNLKKYKQCLNDIDTKQLKALKNIINQFTDIIILGNGGSNAISSHVAQDYTKILQKRAMCFTDASQLSCYANDYGWDYAYTKFLEHFSTENSLVILISSSGESTNILNAAKYCSQNQRKIITLSGMSKTNLLYTQYEQYSEISFWVNSKDYNIVENIHELILLSVI